MMEKKMRKILKSTGILFGILIFGVMVILFLKFYNIVRTLSTLKELNDQDMYEMTYYSDYYFDEFVEEGGEKNDRGLEAFLTEKMLFGIPIDLSKVAPGCSSFMAHNENGDVIFGRNFDYDYTPILVIHTNPKDGYSSVAVADVAFAGYSKYNLPSKDGFSKESILMMAAPYLCEDGMNEKGVAISVMRVPEADNPYIEGAPNLTSTSIVRLVLDKAANVDEAVDLIKKCNVSWWKGHYNHFLISDASGKSVVVEYKDKEMVLVESDTNYQISTNFILHDGKKRGLGIDRYDKIENALQQNNGRFTEQQALEVLKEAKMPGKLQWSSLYNLNTGEICVFPRGNLDNVEHFFQEVTHVDMKASK